jgi:hypothetical protein
LVVPRKANGNMHAANPVSLPTASSRREQLGWLSLPEDLAALDQEHFVA